MPKLTDLEIKGKKIPVHVDPSGEFTAHLDADTPISAKTMEELKEKITKALAQERAKVSIRAIHWAGGGMEHGAFTGIHASNGNFLWRVDGEKGVQQVYSPRLDFLPEELAKEYEALCVAAHEAQRAQTAFEKKHSLDIPKLVTQALNKVES
jgi:hypothetical protein